MADRLVDRRPLFRLLLAVPAALFLADFALAHGSAGRLLGESGEWAARFLILALAVTPVRLLMRQAGLGPRWPMWLFKRRRDIGLAAFLYAALHLAIYVARLPTLAAALHDLPYKEYLAGWAAFALLLVLALTSGQRAVHALGPWWKPMQRLSYGAAAAVLLHWLWIRFNDTAALAHFVPLAALEAYRLWRRMAEAKRVEPRISPEE